MPSRYPQLVKILGQKSLQRGRFTLSSGRVSDYYIDGKLTTFDPEGSALVVDAILNELVNIKYDAVGGMDMGGTPIVGALANRSYHLGRPIPTFIVRKEVKQHGMMKRIEGQLPAPCSVVVIDDVVSTGKSIVQAIEAVHAVGCKVVLAISVLDREMGATETLSRLGVPYAPLASIRDLGIVPESGGAASLAHGG